MVIKMEIINYYDIILQGKNISSGESCTVRCSCNLFNTVESRYLELGYLEFCETRSVYLNQKYNLIASSNHNLALETFLQVQITWSANYFALLVIWTCKKLSHQLRDIDIRLYIHLINQWRPKEKILYLREQSEKKLVGSWSSFFLYCFSGTKISLKIHLSSILV